MTCAPRARDRAGGRRTHCRANHRQMETTWHRHRGSRRFVRRLSRNRELHLLSAQTENPLRGADRGCHRTAVSYFGDLAWKAAIGGATALVAPDSGAIHVAGMTGTPVEASFRAGELCLAGRAVGAVGRAAPHPRPPAKAGRPYGRCCSRLSFRVKCQHESPIELYSACLRPQRSAARAAGVKAFRRILAIARSQENQDRSTTKHVCSRLVGDSGRGERRDLPVRDGCMLPLGSRCSRPRAAFAKNRRARVARFDRAKLIPDGADRQPQTREAQRETASNARALSRRECRTAKANAAET